MAEKPNKFMFFNKIMRTVFCSIGLHFWKTKSFSFTVFVVKEHCNCRFCNKEKIFISENDCL